MYIYIYIVSRHSSREHRALPKFRHLTRLLASTLISFHVLPWCLISSKIVLRHVVRGLPRDLVPWGFHSKAALAMSPGGRRSVWPSHPQRCVKTVNHWCLYPAGAGRDSVVGTATRYGLDGPGIECRWRGKGARFSAPGAHPAFYSMGTGTFPGVKRPGRGADHPPSSSAQVKGRVQLYLYSAHRTSWLVLEWTLYLSGFPMTPKNVCHAATHLFGWFTVRIWIGKPTHVYCMHDIQHQSDAQGFYLLITAPPIFGLSSQPSLGSSQIFRHV